MLSNTLLAKKQNNYVYTGESEVKDEKNKPRPLKETLPETPRRDEVFEFSL